VTPADILKRVARVFGVDPLDIAGKDRTQRIALARHVAMWCCKRELTMSYPEIGTFFGGKDHTTVMSAVAKIDAWREGRAHGKIVPSARAQAEILRAIASSVQLAKADADARDFPTIEVAS
jgi:chromosomal replication initiation ATPase DnaA